MASGKGFGKTIENLKSIDKRILAVKGALKGSNRKSYAIPLPKFSFKSTGLKDLKSFFKEFPQASEKAHAATMKLLQVDLKEALDQAMQSPSWDWKGEMRDIIDTGALRDSGKVEYEPGSETLSISYGEEYAAIVHFGGVTVSGYNPEVRIIYPARPWVIAVLEGGYGVAKFEFEKRYLDYFIDILAKEVG